MAKFVTSEPFAGLAKQLKAINVDRIVDSALAEAGDEYVEILRDLHTHAGADEPLVKAIHSYKDGTAVRAVGIPDGAPLADAAFRFEFGAEDHSERPHGLFRLEAPGMAKHAAENVGAMISARIGSTGPGTPNPSPMQQRLAET